MNKLILILAALAVTNTLYTSGYWKQRGIDVTDGILEPSKGDSININTVCNEVHLNG